MDGVNSYGGGDEELLMCGGTLNLYSRSQIMSVLKGSLICGPLFLIWRDPSTDLYVAVKSGRNPTPLRPKQTPLREAKFNKFEDIFKNETSKKKIRYLHNRFTKNHDYKRAHGQITIH